MADFTPAPVKPIAAIAALEALDIRVGTIERVEDVPRSEKLMKMTVNFGRFSPASRRSAKIRVRSRDAKRSSW
jgi:tRNA-binding EMAP/Myf-like protein